jgi:hypothetical protein
MNTIYKQLKGDCWIQQIKKAPMNGALNFFERVTKMHYFRAFLQFFVKEPGVSLSSLLSPPWLPACACCQAVAVSVASPYFFLAFFFVAFFLVTFFATFFATFFLVTFFATFFLAVFLAAITLTPHIT